MEKIPGDALQTRTPFFCILMSSVMINGIGGGEDPGIQFPHFNGSQCFYEDSGCQFLSQIE